MSPPSTATSATDDESQESTPALTESAQLSTKRWRVRHVIQPAIAAVLFVLLLWVAVHSVLREQDRLVFAGVDAGVRTWLYGISIGFIGVLFVPGLVSAPERLTRVMGRLRTRPAAVVAFCVTSLLVVAGSLFPFITPTAENRPILSLQPPVWGETNAMYIPGCQADIVDGVCRGTMRFPLGTNPRGEDLVTSTLLGLNTTLQVAVSGTVIAATLGIVVGVTAGYVGGRTDEVLMRYVDIQRSVPAFFVYILLLLVLSRGYPFLILVFGLLSWGGIARTVRGEVIQRREAPYMQAVEISGAGTVRTITRHLVPNVSNTVITGSVVLFAKFVLYETALSYLSLTDPVVPSLGNELARATGQRTADPWGAQFTSVPWDWFHHLHIVLVPGAVLCLLVFSVSLLGDSLRDALDPRTTR